jgi:hypothetical protein
MNFWETLWGNLHSTLQNALEAIAMGVLSGDALMMTTGPTCGINVEVPWHLVGVDDSKDDDA